MEAEIDLEALEKNIQATLGEPDDNNVEETEEVAEEATGEENEAAPDESEETFDLDEALNSDQPIALAGRLTEEQAREEAAKRGWKEDGEDRFGHKISAIEFLERAPLFKKISLMRGDIEEQNRKIEALAEQSKKIAQKSIEDKKRLNEELQAAKEKLLSSEYLDSDDVAELKKIDSQIEATAIDEPEQSDEIYSQYEKAKENFVKENDWYRKDYEMTMRADEIGVTYAQEYAAKWGHVPPPEETFNHVINTIKKEYPDQPKPRRQTRVASTQNRTVVSKPKKSKTLSDLPEEQRSIAREVMEAAGLSEEEYLKTYEF